MRLPTVDLQTVGAGGGSIVWLDRAGRCGWARRARAPSRDRLVTGSAASPDRDGRESAPRTPAGDARGRARARPRRGRAGARRHRSGGGRDGGERRDAPSASGRIGRARAGPERLRARRLRRRRAAPRLRARRGARDRHGARPGRGRRPLGARPRRERGAARLTCARTSSRSAEAGELPREGEADLRYARAVARADGASRAATSRRRSTGRTRSGTATPTASRAIELVAVRTAEVEPAPEFELPAGEPLRGRRPGAHRSRGRDLLAPPGWVGVRDGYHAASSRRAVTIQLQVLGSALRAVAEEMGAALVRSAFSANIKERRDCSTALFDARGPHDRAGGAHPRPPRRHARGRGGGPRARARPGRDVGSSTIPSPAARTCRTSRSSRAPRSASRRAAPTTRTSAAWSRRASLRTRREIFQEGLVFHRCG